MKHALLLHGNGGNDTDYFWFEDTKQFLESKGYEVWWPQLPHTDKPQLQETIDFIHTEGPELSDDDIIIGHSSACPAILYLLQTSDVRIKQAVLVAGYYSKEVANEYNVGMLPADGFDFDAIKSKAGEFILINSENDPWGCTHGQAIPVAQALRCKLVLAPGQGHMGSKSFDQPYREFPQLKQFLNID